MKLMIEIEKEDFETIVSKYDTFPIEMKRWGLEAIRNGTPLDKIIAEIERQEKWLLQAGYTAYNIDIAFDAIKSVLAESDGAE